MAHFTTEYLIWAVALGAISAVSLPLGSFVGVQTNPRPSLISLLAAFGAGALIAALSIELVAPTLFELEAAGETSHHGNPYANFYALVLGAAAGGILFSLLDRLVNARGGFLRRTSSTISYLTARHREREMATLEDLSIFPLLKDLPSEHINALMTMIRRVTYAKGEVLLTEGNPGTEAIFVVSGSIDVVSEGGLRHEFGAGTMVGVLALILEQPHAGTGTAKEAISGYSLSMVDFDRLRELSSEFDAAARALAADRLELAEALVAQADAQAIGWLRQAGQALRTGARIPDGLELRQAVKEHKSAPLAIWLGILLDGIPESFVIGAGLLVMLRSKAQALGSVGFSEVVPYTLIAGLFLSNFPEALASSASMRLQGFSKRRVLLLWLSLLVITALGAGVGFLLADSLEHTWVVLAEGLAAGAMLTMIASAMIPEAVHMGKASAVGLATLSGFLAAISFKLLG